MTEKVRLIIENSFVIQKKIARNSISGQAHEAIERKLLIILFYALPEQNGQASAGTIQISLKRR